MRISLKQLLAFDAIARHENVSRAADEIALTQSATSMALGELERQLGAELFHRQGKRLQLNDYGRWLQPRTYQLLQQVREIEQSATSKQLQGVLKIGASSTIGNYLIPGPIAIYVENNPEVHIDLSIGNTEQIVDDMLNLKIDLGLIEGHCHSEKLIATAWQTDHLKIFCSPQHPLASRQTLSFRDLEAFSWILREPGSGTREVFALAIHDKLAPLNVSLELGNSEAIKQAVKNGKALGCLSEMAIAAEIKHGELVALPVSGLNLKRQLYLLKRKSPFESALLSDFKQAISAGKQTPKG